MKSKMWSDDWLKEQYRKTNKSRKQNCSSQFSKILIFFGKIHFFDASW